MTGVKEYSFEEICKMVRTIAAEYGMLLAYLFSPRAHGESGSDSDYDFFVIPSEDCGIFKVADSSGDWRTSSAASTRSATTLRKGTISKWDLL